MGDSAPVLDVSHDEDGDDDPEVLVSEEVASTKKVMFNQNAYDSMSKAFAAAENALVRGTTPWWTKTNVVLVNEETKEFKMSTTCCQKKFEINNISRFWRKHNCGKEPQVRGRQVCTAVCDSLRECLRLVYDRMKVYDRIIYDTCR